MKKIDKQTIASFILLVLIAALYRVLPGRPLGFAPQIAMAIFGGSVIADKKMSFLLPLLSMLISDIIYEILFKARISDTPGFYDGQWINYLLFASLTFIGFYVGKKNVSDIIAGSIVGATAYFLASNFFVWIGNGLDINNLPYPKTFAGLTSCYAAGLPFYKGSLFATLLFSGVLFGGYYLINKYLISKDAQVASS